jgi:formylglycine-generating enzyme required for sulfatase activity
MNQWMRMTLAAATACTILAPALMAAEPYVEKIPGTEIEFKMVPIPGGTFKMGSPDDEADRRDDEGPQVQVKVDPFWMGAHEVTWDEFDEFCKYYELEKQKDYNPLEGQQQTDAVSYPTPQYEEGIALLVRMGRSGGFPAADMTQTAAKMYCKWLSKKTGHFYRLPTEAEWEYACRAGTTTAYSFGNNPDDLEDFAIYIDNAEGADGEPAYRKVGTKKPNPWGLYDMHGNVAEWTLDQYDAEHYAKMPQPVSVADATNWAVKEYPVVVRGGSWNDFGDLLRSATRIPSSIDWNEKDPQVPQSIWYHTEAFWVGFRVVRPATEPDVATKLKYWEPLDEYVKELMLKQGDKQIRVMVQPAE